MVATSTPPETSPPQARPRPSRGGGARRGSELTRRWHEQAAVSLLVADPEPVVAADLTVALRTAGVTLTWCADGAEALLRIGSGTHHAVVLAAPLPVVDAAAVVRAARQVSSVPILVAAGAEDLPLAGEALVAGATALLSRPYVAEEVVSALEEHWDRIGAAAPAPLVYGPLVLDPLAFSARLHGRELDLPPREFAVLRLLLQHADHVVTTEQIQQAVWGRSRSGPGSNGVAVHVLRLRARLGGPDVLRTVRGVGYRLTFPEPGPG